MRVIFVGVHNKPGKRPLCSSTKSGKLIDKIIRQVPADVECLKTNLFDIEQMPEKRQINHFVFDWIERIKLHQDDVVVLLGRIVHKAFPENLPVKKIKIAHPASKRSHKAMSEYVNESGRVVLENFKQGD